MKFELLRVRVGSWVVRASCQNLVCYLINASRQVWSINIEDAQQFNRLADAEAALAEAQVGFDKA